jgi:hypothetical protein
MIAIVSASGGLGSTEAWKRTVERYGKENTVVVFADVKGDGRTHTYFSPMPEFLLDLLHERYGGESRDTYRFLWQLSHHFDTPINVVKYKSNSIFTTFAERRAFRIHAGGAFVCPASQKNKRVAIANWIKENYGDEEITMVLGMGWDEEHRTKNAQYWWSKVMGREIPVWAPNAEKPYADNMSISAWLMELGIEIPSAYKIGLSHNNCGGGCTQAGLSHWAKLYFERREVYLYWAEMERQLQVYMGKFVTILKRTKDGVGYPKTCYERTG